MRNPAENPASIIPLLQGSAGHYGDYSCDLPPVTLDLFLKEISSLDPPPDIVVYTGDNPPHDIWMESFAGQIEATQSLVEYVRQGLANTTIYPALGNHGVCVVCV